MADILSLFAQINVNYIRGQIVLFPLFLVYILLRKGNLRVSHQYAVHSAIVILSLVIPAFLAIDFHSFIIAAPETLIMPALKITGAVNKNISSPFLLPWYTVAGMIGLTGALYLGFQLIRQYFLERNLIRTCKILKTIKNVSLVVSEKVSVPFSTGLIKHRIYMPSRLYLERGSRDLVFRHEALHVRNGHTVFAFLEMLNRSLFWFNPLSHVHPSIGGLTREHLCDEFVIVRHPVNDYCRLLVREAQILQEFKGLVLTNSLGKQSLKKRIKYLLEKKMKKTSKFAMMALASGILVTVALFISVGCSDEPVISKSVNDGTLNNVSNSPSMKSVSRSKASIMRVIMQNLVALRYAYNKRLREKPGIFGKIVVKFAIDNPGAVVSCSVLKSTVNDKKLESILCAKIKKWKFEEVDKPGDISEVVYPFVFSH